MISVQREGELCNIHISTGILKTRHVVIATPSIAAKKLISLPEINKGKDVYVFHLEGTIKEEYKMGTLKFFGYTTPLFCILKREDNSYLICSFRKDIDIKEWFKEYRIIAVIEWHPMYNTEGNVLLDASQGKGLWLIGDHNIIGMENVFMTGLYAANEIARQNY